MNEYTSKKIAPDSQDIVQYTIVTGHTLHNWPWRKVHFMANDIGDVVATPIHFTALICLEDFGYVCSMGAIFSMSVHHGIPFCPPKLLHFSAICVFSSKLQNVAKKHAFVHGKRL